jgi:hypothetical protein
VISNHNLLNFRAQRFLTETFTIGSNVMAGLVVPAIHDFNRHALLKSWMPDMKSGMALWIQNMVPSKIVTLWRQEAF